MLRFRAEILSMGATRQSYSVQLYRGVRGHRHRSFCQARPVRVEGFEVMPRSTSLRSAFRVPIRILVAVSVLVAGGTAATAATTNPNPTPLELRNQALAERIATEGMVLLENRDNTLPIAKSGNVALYGVGAYATPVNGVGSAEVHNRHSVLIREGLEDAGYHITTSSAYWDAMTYAYQHDLVSPVHGVWGGVPEYSSVEQLLTAESVRPTAPTNTAIYVLSRTAGENYDRSSGPGDYEPTATELADLRLIGQTYKRVVVVINSNGVVDTSFFKQIDQATHDPSGGSALDSLLFMSQAGEESGTALAKVLNGSVTPSGKLTDTWATKYSYYPASATFGLNDSTSNDEVYNEGIYVGYRYFDSFYKTIDHANPAGVVAYPFGYGLSYARFAISVRSVKADMHRVTVTARVRNTGTKYTGKEVVQVYFSAPQNGLDKPYQQLAGYAKTDNLAPGASQTLTIGFQTTAMASYDQTQAAWTMDPGNYLIRVGDSSRSTHVVARVRLPHRLVTEELNNEANDQVPAKVLSSSPTNFYSYPSERTETAASPSIVLHTSGFRTEIDASPYEQNVAVDPSSPYYAFDGSPISSTTAYLDPRQANWEGTGAPYVLKTGESARFVPANRSDTLYDVAKGKITMHQFVAGLSVAQLANIVEGSGTGGSLPTPAGAAGFTTGKYESLGIPALPLVDATSGLRLTPEIPTTPPSYQYETDFPIATMVAQTWNRNLVKSEGEAIGKEMRQLGITMWLGPGVNIHRDPLNGRNFEYYSEDPLLTGLIGAAVIEGVQSIRGEGAVIKHFAANNQETNRRGGNSIVGERELREIELRGFEIAVKSAQPMGAMSAYNKLNGTYTSQDYDLLTDILRGEWNFKGVVMSDWGGSHDPVATMYAGNDLIEPGAAPQDIENAIELLAPTIDISGLPVYNKVVAVSGPATYSWLLGGLQPSATGTTTVSTTIDASTDLSQTPASGTTTVNAINNQVFVPDPKFTSVNDAYTRVSALLASSALTPTQKSGIRLTKVIHQVTADPNSPVISYTVVLTGNYPADSSYTLRLGDLQRSAMHVLNVAMQSAQFAQLAASRGMHGIVVRPYGQQFPHLLQLVTVHKSTITHIRPKPRTVDR
jgi:beta-glucosidase